MIYNRNDGTSALNGIYSWSTGDSVPTQLVMHEDVVDFVMDSEYFYFLQRNSSSIYRAPRAGGAAEPIGSSISNPYRLIHQDADSLYVARTSCCLTDISRVIK